MNNKKVIFGGLLAILTISNSFAVTDQLNAAKAFLSQQENNSEVIVDNTENSSTPFAVAPLKELKPNNRSEVLKLLQSQLDLEETGVFDKKTLKYVQEFQEENGFNVTNTLDYNTWFALFEQSDDWKKYTIESSEKIWQDVLEKQKEENSKKFVVVNIPTMTLTAYDWDGENATEALISKVVVGKPTTQTPLKEFHILSIKYNPTWTPTEGILKRGAYKNGKLDYKWIEHHRLEILDTHNHIVPPDQINPEEKYHFQQPAGNQNALGILKFETNSPDNIYLHDTNEKYYFGYNTRTYSSGCIRVQNFKELANWIRNKNDVDEKLKRKDTYYEKVEKTPVYITYSQVIFYGNNPLFAPDIYSKNNNTKFEN